MSRPWVLSPIMVDKIFEVVKDVYAQGVTVLLVEQNASRALAIANRGLCDGVRHCHHERRREAICSRIPRVRAAYLGE
jgi:branched-chain amino acid transport system ATP-binding protein